MSKIKLCLCLIVISLLGTPVKGFEPTVEMSVEPTQEPWVPERWIYAVPYGATFQLLKDTAFHDGFRAFWSCKEFQGVPDDDSIIGLGYLGDCIDYFTPYANTQGKNYAIRTWPDAGAPNDANKYWSFNEGLHRGFSAYGYEFGPPGEQSPAKDLAAHRLEANQESSNGVVTGGLYGLSPNLIWLQSMNNLSTADPHYGELVRSVSSDRNGTIMMYMNTRNEIRNVATENSSTFAYDTWPHFGLEQNFKKVIDLATLDDITMSANVEIPLAQFLSGWPPGWQSIDFSVGYMLRRKDNPAVVVFLGYPLYSTVPSNLTGRFFVDQFGSTAYSGNVADLGGAITPAQSGDGVHNTANYRFIWFELRTLMNKALAKAASFSYSDEDLEAGRIKFLQYTIDDYYLASFGFGWETLGYQHVQSYVSGVSIYASPRMIFDSEVYQQPSDPTQPSTYKTYNDPAHPGYEGYDEGEMRAHWAKYGCHEGRVASTTFDVKIYMDRWGSYMPQCYNNGARNYECAIAHYVLYGRAAQHWGHW